MRNHFQEKIFSRNIMHGARGSAVIADLTIGEICLIYPKFG